MAELHKAGAAAQAGEARQQEAGDLRIFATLAATYRLAETGGRKAEVRRCRTRSISLERIVVEAEETLKPGTRLYLNIAGIGICPGAVERTLSNGFILANDVSASDLSRLVPKLRWLKRYYARDTSNLRSNERHLMPPHTVELARADGASIMARLYDLSMSGMAVLTEWRPDLGSAVTVGGREGTVVRHFEGGVAIQFDDSLPVGEFAAALAPARPRGTL